MKTGGLQVPILQDSKAKRVSPIKRVVDPNSFDQPKNLAPARLRVGGSCNRCLRVSRPWHRNIKCQKRHSILSPFMLPLDWTVARLRCPTSSYCTNVSPAFRNRLSSIAVRTRTFSIIISQPYNSPKSHPHLLRGSVRGFHILFRSSFWTVALALHHHPSDSCDETSRSRQVLGTSDLQTTRVCSCCRCCERNLAVSTVPHGFTKLSTTAPLNIKENQTLHCPRN